MHASKPKPNLSLCMQEASFSPTAYNSSFIVVSHAPQPFSRHNAILIGFAHSWAICTIVFHLTVAPSVHTNRKIECASQRERERDHIRTTRKRQIKIVYTTAAPSYTFSGRILVIPTPNDPNFLVSDSGGMSHQQQQLKSHHVMCSCSPCKLCEIAIPAAPAA